MKAAIYCRVSTEDQNVRQQAMHTKEWALRQGFIIDKIIMDEESGRLPLTLRKNFMTLLDQILAKKYDTLIIYNLDRLTRNWDDVVYIEKIFRDNYGWLKLISTSDVVDFNNASGRMMFRIKMAISCYMPEDMREKQKIGIDRAKAEGKYKGGQKGRSWI